MESFVPISPDTYYPMQNLPYSTGKVRSSSEIHCLSRIGDFVIDLTNLEMEEFLSFPYKLFDSPTLNKFMSQDRALWQSVRSRLQYLLRVDISELRDSEHKDCILIPISEVELTLPVNIGDFTDFSGCRNHLAKVLSEDGNPKSSMHLNWVHMPIGYHSRSSSVVLQGDVIRPRGQVCVAGHEPEFKASTKLDYEVEIGYFVGGSPNLLGEPINISQAYDHIFGIVLLNDWSARDIGSWEIAPLGLFTSKNFHTTISPWIVTLEALEPFKKPLPLQDPVPFPYLNSQDNFYYDIDLKTYLEISGTDQQLISKTNMKHVYWSIIQQLTHHTVTGCNLRVGDLLGTGTISGPNQECLGSLIEISDDGKKPIIFSNGQQRCFLEDGDSVTIVGECNGQEYFIGLELPKSTIKPALKDKYLG